MTDTNKLKELARPKEDFDTQCKLEDAKEKIVEAMCMTWRHDFGLSKRHGQFGYSGMTPDEQNSLRSRMGQLFDHHIAHFVRNEEERSRSLFTLESGILSLQSDLIDELRAEAEQLRSRLEIDERIPHDGISCRDETIKALDEKCDKLKAENNALRKFSAEAYQVLGALDAPENVLDNASDAANGVPLRHETLLPFFAEDYEALRKDAARYRGLRDEGYLHNWASLHVCDEHLRAQRTDEAIDSVLNIGAKQ